MATGWNFHELYLWHDTGNAATLVPAGADDRAGRARRERRHQAALPQPPRSLGPARPAHPHRRASPSARTISPCSTHRDYIARIKALSADRGGDASHLTPFGPGSYEIACLAVGGTTALIDAVAAGRVAQRLCAGAPARPPRRARRGHGVLPVRQRADRHHEGAAPHSGSAASPSSTGTCTTATAPSRPSTTTPTC